MTLTTILQDTRGAVGRITLNRPQALNALNSRMISEINTAIEAFEQDQAIGCIILRGSERAFAAGADIREMQDKSFPSVLHEDFLAQWDKIAACRKPLIAEVAGLALGGGCELALMCDIILAADTAIFGQPEIRLGIIPGAGATQRLVKRIGLARAAELCLTGRQIRAEEAERCGLVSRVCPADQLEQQALEMAQQIASQSRAAVFLLRQALKAAENMPLTEGLRLERQSFYALFATPDQKEGMAAFLEKRTPRFSQS